FHLTFVEEGVLNSWSVPDKVLFTDSIPKTSVGKMDKKKLRADLAATLTLLNNENLKKDM
ncbi:MAG: hypothetical protein M1378_09470, partial [Bacteroidetes bacterium]|nr:hypothetical protein [Bacteroidota bacterium]